MKIGKSDESVEIETAGHPPSSRRDALKKAAALLGGVAGAAVLPAVGSAEGSSAAGARAQDNIIARDEGPVVTTEQGKVIGYLRNGIFTFKGIPYGQTTEGANRFMPPKQLTPWSGVRSSRQYGNVSPQGARTGWAHDEEAFMFAWDDGIQGEDCLRINIWSPGVNDGKKRPVMVWLHGGGFAAGSGQELRAYDGENLARRGDVVVVSLNHRLNAFGYLDLSKYGEKYASSANVGMLDIVAALEWVRDNIAAFGGNPQVVTIFGQSGGGGKVAALMAMPAARGLFHRAIVQSGSMLKVGTPESAQKLSESIVTELGLTAATIDQIQTLPFARLVQASATVLQRRSAMKSGTVPNFRKMADNIGFAPVVDGKILPVHPFAPQASPTGADVPMIIGTTLNEFVHAIDHPENEAMTAAQLEERVRTLFGDKTPAVIAAFQRRTPDAKPFDLYSRIAASTVRENAIKQARIQSAAGQAKTYLYWFTWQTPILNGRPRAFHCAELPFVFYNTDRCETMTGGGPDALALAAKMSDAWIQFARTGNPNHPNLAHWPEFSSAVPTMLFDRKSQAVPNPDGEEQASIAEG